jgi:hypothetical protein
MQKNLEFAIGKNHEFLGQIGRGKEKIIIN